MWWENVLLFGSCGLEENDIKKQVKLICLVEYDR